MDDRAGLCFASALSDVSNTPVAVERVVADLAQQMRGAADLVVVFVTGHPSDSMDLIGRQLADQLSPKVLLGVTGGGVIGRQHEVEGAAGLSVLAARLPGAQIRAFDRRWTDASDDSCDELIESLDGEKNTPQAVLLLADPFSTPMANVLSTFASRWPGVPVVGGMASGASKPGGNRLFVNGRVCRDGLVGLVIDGGVRVGCIISQGCRPVGTPLVITKSQRHIVYELGGRDVVSVLQEMIEQLHPEERHLVQTRGLMVGRVIDEYKERYGRGDFLIRQVLAVDQEAGYLAINDPQVRVGQTVQFHVHDQKTAVEDFKLLLEGEKLYGPAGGAILVSCNGRGRNLFGQPHTDAQIVHEAMGDMPLAGFFAAGEIGPVGNENFLHGHTASLILFRALVDP